ncbi:MULTISPECIES: methionine/alanine import family NSS transporter small subunit [unclassified Arthrobacter]|nr:MULTISPECIES: methionine/alanine import family NSS transporter small subunit [unclassified Arthrobacter]MDO5753428.1 methionine/alanine import family NSS transporter small subunit [Arthrobacter sp.]
MTPVAITMMIIALLTVWGGLGLALWNLSRHPEEKEDQVLEEVSQEL